MILGLVACTFALCFITEATQRQLGGHWTRSPTACGGERKELKFIHITKTGGSAIEKLGRAHGLDWGMFHAEYGWWHGPFASKPTWLKQKYHWFMVVRNPFDRLISEFHCVYGGVGNRVHQHDKVTFNSHLRKKMYMVLYHPRHILAWVYTMLGLQDPNLDRRGHWVQQYRSVDREACVHILRFESLADDFNWLMKEYGLLNETVTT